MMSFSISKRVFDVGTGNDSSFTLAAWKGRNEVLSFYIYTPLPGIKFHLKVDIVLVDFLFNNEMQSNDCSLKNNFKFSESYDKDFLAANSKVIIWEFSHNMLEKLKGTI